jgi:hypothetical protein
MRNNWKIKFENYAETNLQNMTFNEVLEYIKNFYETDMILQIIRM